MLRSAWLLLLCLLASSLVAATTVHAQERYSAAEIACGEVEHAEGDAGQGSDDQDRSAPHHHGTCHGHGLSAPAGTASTPILTAPEAPDASGATRLARRTIGPVLEPPRG
ncbi:hypothetical protein Q9Q95_14805 [Sphingomonas sp. DG1-23]|uniref:hypothetical protein n=1 Tax=Sphingomonas sp. DG1-23 TaxID=3068316 RepID=UPI00273DC2AE|nr:hypothetical protein [Sphingomonas sp. DG1-23]MDP5280196.1 hypothetical protein [Sphingomonas sp. DG1-23]